MERIDLKFQFSRNNYRQKIGQIKQALRRGDIYQLNFTFKGTFEYHGEPAALYQKLRKNQPTAYSAYLESGEWRILSLSPELFFQKEGNRLNLKPMKGTATTKQARSFLRKDEKNRSENLMIVDLLRNDLGKIAPPGSIQVPRLFTVENYPSLRQMTSTISGLVPEKIKLQNIFSALFPSGSVTGAPKISAMRLIQKLEEEPRNIYTGAIGYITPQREMLFNVAIRTLLLKKEKGNDYQGEIGLGSGIVIDSDWQEEYDECLLKSDFLKGA